MALIDRFQRPLDWTRGRGRPSAAAQLPLTIIVPVYGAAAALRDCLDSLQRETDLQRHRLLLVIDGPQDNAVEQAIAGLPLLRNPERLGFVGSVNRGMQACAGDVVLLNSDTVVTPGWADKLIAAAYSDGDIGTVTPLSNNGSLCSVPQTLVENLIPDLRSAAAFAELVESVSQREYPRLPTGVGFCLYIRRALLDDISLFDAHRFGLGYGEENDFCLRAMARGWLHVADDATFIQHAGHASFSHERKALQKRAAKVLNRLHPRYRATIADCMRRDPLRAVRERIVRSLQPSSAAPAGTAARRLRIVHLLHGWPPFQQAGTELYAAWLAHRQAARHEVAVYARSADPAREHGEAREWMDRGIRVRLLNNPCLIRDPWRRNGLRDRAIERDFDAFLQQTQPDLLHIHHLSGHAFSLAAVARRRRIPVLMQIQDWWFLCARANQFDRDGQRCSGPAPEKCARCISLSRLPPAALSNRLLHAERRRHARAALACADAYVAGSRAIRDDYLRAGVIAPDRPFHVIPYGIDLPVAPPAPRLVDGPIRFGYVGSITPHKGLHVAAEAMGRLPPGRAELHLWGNAEAHPDYTRRLLSICPDLHFAGRFAEADKPRVFASMDVLLVPSIGLESFCLVAREAMACGVPVIATGGGALDELFEHDGGGRRLPAADATALAEALQALIDDPQQIERWRGEIVPPKGNDQHAAEIEAIYRSLLPP